MIIGLLKYITYTVKHYFYIIPMFKPIVNTIYTSLLIVIVYNKNIDFNAFNFNYDYLCDTSIIFYKQSNVQYFYAFEL